MVWKSGTNLGTLATLEEAFYLASSKFKIADLNDYQKLAIRKTVVEKDEDTFVYLENLFISVNRVDRPTRLPRLVAFVHLPLSLKLFCCFTRV